LISAIDDYAEKLTAIGARCTPSTHSKASNEPSRWRDTQGAKALIIELEKKTVISGLKEISQIFQ
jgi:hypothetical protein